ncbi:hypothetical protein MIND_00989600 [Mycena indigotica]|uniref:Uncharacterized protein n=1 Tax=Mycena indigotica TaxID=2126181 RepID=A0A8H6S7V7_9AGAR|nr:uncharacterized protein MIND_00989600 [Mycena indigotica]KAF7294531.1 hypothetical protein MIND_00989600 [Mycena indigotica]
MSAGLGKLSCAKGRTRTPVALEASATLQYLVSHPTPDKKLTDNPQQGVWGVGAEAIVLFLYPMPSHRSAEVRECARGKGEARVGGKFYELRYDGRHCDLDDSEQRPGSYRYLLRRTTGGKAPRVNFPAKFPPQH